MDTHPLPPCGGRLIRVSEGRETAGQTDERGALWRPSPNFGPRRGGALPDMVVIHYTAMRDAESALERLCDPDADVSAHYLIAADGTLIQMVREADRAWHAGAGAWGAVTDVNSRSIGIELDNRGDHPFCAPQMAVLERLLSGIMDRWFIPPARVIGHSDMAPSRKSDPGRRFDWARLVRQGLAVAPVAGAGDTPDPDVFRACLAKAGYTCVVSDDAALLEALRARHAPHAQGPLSPADIALAKALAEQFPVDQGPHSA